VGVIAGERAIELRYVVAAMLVMAVILGAQLIGWGIYEAVHHDTTKYELITRCLEREKQLALVPTPTQDPFTVMADQGAFSTTIEGNRLDVAVTSSSRKAERLAAEYRAIFPEVAGRLETLNTGVYLWTIEPTPTQRQTAIDCVY
jgi:hypothetical protein